MIAATGHRPAARAAFLDRDGVINREKNYLHRVAEFEFLPGAVAAMRRLQDAGYLLVVITNQSGLARGLFTEADYGAVTDHMRAQLALAGIALAGVYHCPHLPDAKVAAFRADCDCRKPRPGMLQRAAVDLGIDPGLSILFGDKGSDVAAGRAAGVGKCWLVRSGHQLSAQDESRADGIGNDLASAVAQLLDEGA